MKQLLKKAYKVGNSAGVVVPKEWMNGFVEVKLVEPPIRLDASSILKILQQENIDTSRILGIAITGSYAKEEHTLDSDVDILVITDNLNKKINVGRYEIIILSEEILKSQLENMGFPILPMILESKTIINKKLFEKYKKNKLNKKALKWLIDTTRSSIKISKEQTSILKELGEKKVSDNISYSLILRLRTIFIIEKLIKNKSWNKKDFLNLIKKVSGSLIAYEGYIRVKNNKKIRKELLIEDVERLVEYITKKTEKWIKNKENSF